MAEVKLDEILNNSNSARREDETSKPPAPTEEFNPYVEEPVKMKKPNFFARFVGLFGISENFEGAGDMVLKEVVIPAIIDGLRDSIYAATDYILYGSGQRSRSGGSRNRGRKDGYTEYGKKSQQRSVGRGKTSPSASAYYFTFDVRSDAEKVLEQMRDVCDQRDFVTIMDMFAIARRQTSNYTYNDWGWYDLRSALVRRTNDGRFYLDLPKPVPIED